MNTDKTNHPPRKSLMDWLEESGHRCNGTIRHPITGATEGRQDQERVRFIVTHRDEDREDQDIIEEHPIDGC